MKKIKLSKTDQLIDMLENTIILLSDSILNDSISREKLKIYAKAYLKNFSKKDE